MIPSRNPQMRTGLPEVTYRPAPGVRATATEYDSRLTAEEYAAWLLPPRPRDGLEKIVQAMSLGAGVVALIGGFGAAWWLL